MVIIFTLQKINKLLTNKETNRSPLLNKLQGIQEKLNAMGVLPITDMSDGNTYPKYLSYVDKQVNTFIWQMMKFYKNGMLMEN